MLTNMTDMSVESLPSTPLAVNHSPRTENRLKNAWANASRDAVRYNELYETYLNMYNSYEQKEISQISDETRDRAQAHAWLTIFAESGNLFVKRISKPGRWYHDVSIRDYEGNEIAYTRGFVTGMDVALGKWDRKYVRWTEKVGENKSRIRLMTDTILPDLLVFQRADGTPLDLGWTDDYFDFFDITLDDDAIEDDFEQLDP